MIGELGLDDWYRYRVGPGELDAMGPVARDVLSRHGLFWPFNAHLHDPLVRAAHGGSLITGFGGDEVGRSSRAARAGQVLTGRRRPTVRDPLVVGLALAPLAVRTLVHYGRERASVDAMPWLTSAGRRAVLRGFAAMEATVPWRWDRALTRWFPRLRYFNVATAGLGLLGIDHDVVLHHPFIDPGVLLALARAGGAGGLGGRTQLMQRIFGELLPEALLSRCSKATFTDPLWGERSRDFARRWSGGGVPADLVDVDALRRHWCKPDINLLSVTLLQAAWIHEREG